MISNCLKSFMCCRPEAARRTDTLFVLFWGIRDLVLPPSQTRNSVLFSSQTRNLVPFFSQARNSVLFSSFFLFFTKRDSVPFSSQTRNSVPFFSRTRNSVICFQPEEKFSPFFPARLEFQSLFPARLEEPTPGRN